MSEHEEEISADENANSRRNFLKSGAAATSAVLGLSVLGATNLVAQSAEVAAKAGATSSTRSPNIAAANAVAPTLQLNLKDHAALAKIGGSKIVPIAGDTLIVARTDVSTFAVCSAICTHKGCKVEYLHASKCFECPCHGAQFGLDGKVLQGPAKSPLKNYASDVAAVISLPTSSAPAMPKK